MWWFCNCANIAKACTSVDGAVNKTTTWLYRDLNWSHMLPCTLNFFFCPTALIKSFSTYLSKKCWNKEKRKSYKLQHAGPLPTSDPWTKTSPYLRSNTSAEADISITNYYKHGRPTTASHLRGFKTKHWHMYRQCHLSFVFLRRYSPDVTARWATGSWVAGDFTGLDPWLCLHQLGVMAALKPSVAATAEHSDS